MKKIDSGLYTNNKHFDSLTLKEKINYLEDILSKTINTGFNKNKGLNWQNHDLPSIQYNDINSILSFQLFENKRFIGKNNIVCSFNLQMFPGCCGIALFHRFYIDKQYQRLGIGELIVSLVEVYSQLSGYTVIVCTDVINNIPMKTILTRRGWNSAFNFINIRTGNNVELSYKNLVK